MCHRSNWAFRSILNHICLKLEDTILNSFHSSSQGSHLNLRLYDFNHLYAQYFQKSYRNMWMEIEIIVNAIENLKERIFFSRIRGILLWLLQIDFSRKERKLFCCSCCIYETFIILLCTSTWIFLLVCVLNKKICLELDIWITLFVWCL